MLKFSTTPVTEAPSLKRPTLSTPNAIFCERVSILSVQSGGHRALAGTTPYGMVGVWLDVEPSEGFVLRAPEVVEVPPEGDVMLF